MARHRWGDVAGRSSCFLQNPLKTSSCPASIPCSSNTALLKEHEMRVKTTLGISSKGPWRAFQVKDKPDYDKVRKAISDLLESEKAEEYDDGGPMHPPCSLLPLRSVTPHQEFQNHPGVISISELQLSMCRLLWPHSCALGMALIWQL